MRITKEQMESRQRIARIAARITDAIADEESGVSYEEAIVALTEAAHRWASHSWRMDFNEPD